MVVHYPRTVWKNCYAEHEVTGETYKKKKKKKKNPYFCSGRRGGRPAGGAVGAGCESAVCLRPLVVTLRPSPSEATTGGRAASRCRAGNLQCKRILFMTLCQKIV